MGFCHSLTKLTASEKNPSIQILASDERGLTVSFEFLDWTVQKVRINGEDFTKIQFQGAYFEDGIGLPQIPYHVAVIGIPQGADVRYTILNSDYETIDRVKVLPNPQPKKVEGWAEKIYLQNDEIYQSSSTFPVELLNIDEPALYREQQIVRLQVAGARYLPQENRLLTYNKITIRLDFVGGENSGQANPTGLPRLEENLYKNKILNYKQSAKWRDVRPSDVSIRKSSSLLSGTLYKFTVQEEGIYKIDGAFLEENTSLNLTEIDPNKIRLFNNGGRELPQDINKPRPDGLIENAILVQDGGDGRFDRDDFILFYGIGVEGWEYDANANSFSHYINHYGFDNVYWLSFEGSQNGKRMEQVGSGQIGGNVIETYQGLTFLEDERFNPLASGLNWFAREFATDEISRERTFNLDLPNAVSDEPVLAKFRFISRNSGQHRFAVSLNDNVVGTHDFFGATPFLGQYLRMQASDVSMQANGVLQPGENSLRISYSHSSTNGQALLDWFEVFYTAELNAIEGELGFTVAPDSGLRSYRVSNFPDNDVQLFDITDFSNVRQFVGLSVSNGSFTFADVQQPDPPKRYLALNTSKYRSIENLERMEVKDLRDPSLGGEFIVITHDDFYSEGLRLESLRENGNPDNRLETEVARISDVYNTFSGGLADPTAIRDFVNFAYDNWTPKPAYVLLLGDGDYDYKNIESSSDKNWVPTFQTDELPEDGSLAQLVSRTTDSWYTYVSGEDRIMDLAIGRLNVQTLAEAKSAVDKIIAYETQPLRGNWRNTVTMVGDDELVGGGRASAVDDVHIRQTESIAENSFPNCFDVGKIYLTEFPKVISSSRSGVIKPAAREALIRQINKGTLVVNYIGHGNSSVWAHEAVFRQSDNDRVQNIDKLVFFVAATCDWALFDDPTVQSQAEELLVAEKRGAIAILSSARLVFSSGNFAFNRSYYENLFSGGGQTNRIGDAFVATRIRTGNITNDEKFHIYGDPTLRLAIPRQEAVITSMTPDSIVALKTVEIRGEVRQGGQVQEGFNGTVFLNTFDSRRFVQNIPEAGSVQNYFLPGNSIFRGTVPVENGRFNARFIVPKDISYGGTQARVSAYFWNDEVDGSGCRDNIKVSSTSANLADNSGPEIQIYFKGHENFTTGDIIDENVTMVVDIADTVSGINIAGEIGHRLTLTIDPNEETCLSQLNRFNGISNIDLTDLFQFKEGDHLSGTVEFPLSFPKEVNIGGQTVPCVNLDGENRHTLVVKAWDNANNSSTASVEVLVVHQEGLVVKDIMNYPNPFAQETTFTFISNQDAEVVIKIYTVSGQLIRTLEYPFATSGFNMIEWNGRDARGDLPANGVYLYKLIARSPGESGMIQEEFVGRLAIIR